MLHSSAWAKHLAFILLHAALIVAQLETTQASALDPTTQLTQTLQTLTTSLTELQIILTPSTQCAKPNIGPLSNIFIPFKQHLCPRVAVGGVARTTLSVGHDLLTCLGSGVRPKSGIAGTRSPHRGGIPPTVS